MLIHDYKLIRLVAHAGIELCMKQGLVVALVLDGQGDQPLLWLDVWIRQFHNGKAESTCHGWSDAVSMQLRDSKERVKAKIKSGDLLPWEVRSCH